MADSHGAAYNHSAETMACSGDLPYQSMNNYGGYGGDPHGATESRPDGDGDTDDVGAYAPLPPNGGFMTDRQRGYDSGGGWN